MPIPFTVTTENKALLRVLTNERRMRILNYLKLSRMATNKVIARVLQLLPSQVTKDLKLLMQAGLIRKEKIGTQRICFLQEDRLQALQSVFFLEDTNQKGQ